MGLEEQLLAASLSRTIHDARQAEQKLSYLIDGNTLNNIEEGPHAEQLRMAEETLDFYVEKVFRDVAILAERMHLPQFAEEVKRKRNSISNLSKMVLAPEDPCHVCLPLIDGNAYFESVQTMVNGRAQTGLAVFERILQNTGTIIGTAGLIPNNEAKVRAEVRKTLQFCFDDVVREIPIVKNLKTYKPDIGVASLMAAAEYKFIDSKEDAKNSLDEVYSDMKGYHGRYDWRSFYMAVLVTAIHADMKREIATKETRIRANPDSSRLRRGVDARDKHGHDGVVGLASEPWLTESNRSVLNLP